MPTLNEVKYAALSGVLAKDAKLNELEIEWLIAEQGAVAPGTVNELWYQVFAKALPWNGAAHDWLTRQGIPLGALNERWYQYWEAIDPNNQDIVQLFWNPGLDGSDGAYNASGPVGVLSPDTWDGNTITYFGSVGTDTFRVTMPQLVGVTSIRVTIDFQGKIRQADLTWNAGGYYEGTMADARQLTVAQVGIATNIILRKLPETGGIVTPDLTMTVGGASGLRGYRRGSYGSAAPDQLTDGNEIRRVTIRNSNGNVVFTVEGTYPQDEFTTMQVVGHTGVLTTASATHVQIGGETIWEWAGAGSILGLGDVVAVEFS